MKLFSIYFLNIEYNLAYYKIISYYWFSRLANDMAIPKSRDRASGPCAILLCGGLTMTSMTDQQTIAYNNPCKSFVYRPKHFQTVQVAGMTLTIALTVNLYDRPPCWHVSITARSGYVPISIRQMTPEQKMAVRETAKKVLDGVGDGTHRKSKWRGIGYHLRKPLTDIEKQSLTSYACSA